MKKVIVKTKRELKELIRKTIKKEGPNCDLNFIDTSLITDMYYLFHNTEFNGDISKWDVSHVTNMYFMFHSSMFNGDISQWNVGNVTNMACMFMNSWFNGNISKWNTSKVTDVSYMFYGSKFNGDISKWDVSNVKDMVCMFMNSQFNGDLSRWDVGNVENMCGMFSYSKFNQDIGEWNVENVINMSKMFKNSKFNKDISDWDTCNIGMNDFRYFGLQNESYLPLKLRNPLVQSKSYTGWKKLKDDLICKLLIPENAVKLKGASNKCRASKAKVICILDEEGTEIDTGYSIHDSGFIYKVGEEVVPDGFDPDRWNECSSGIHFFLTKEEAEKYY